MTRAIASPAIHVVPPATSSQLARQTKPTEEAGFAHQLRTLMQPRAATPMTPGPRKAANTAPESEIENSEDTEKGAGAAGARAGVGATTRVARDATPPANSTDDSYTASTEAPPSATRTTSTPSAEAARPVQAGPTAPAERTTQAPTSSTAHPSQSPIDGPGAADAAITALAGWITMRAELDTHEATVDVTHIAASEAKPSQSAALAQAANGCNRSPIVLPAIAQPSGETHAPEPVREPLHPTSDSSTPDTQEMEPSSSPSTSASTSPAPQSAEAPPVPAGVTVLAVASASPNAAAASDSKGHEALASTAAATADAAFAAAMTATTMASDAAVSSPDTSASDGTTSDPAPDLTSTVAANTMPSTPADRITLQLPTDQGSARIQISVSNGMVVTRIMMPDATSAAHLSAASGELHDALARQGFDAVKIAVPVPPSSGLSPLGHSAEQSPDRTPDRTSQQSFTSAQDHKTPGRPQQRPRRQRER